MRNARLRPGRWALGALLLLACFPRPAWADLSPSISVSPRRTSAPVNLSIAVNVVWSLTFVGGICSGSQEIATSGIGIFTSDSNPPSSSNTLGTVAVSLTVTKPSSAPSPAAFSVTETPLVSADVTAKALARGLRLIFYQRQFISSCLGIAFGDLDIVLVSGAAGPFAVDRMEIRFADGLSTITVPRGREGLKVQVEIRYSGTGTFRFQFRVAEPGAPVGRALQLAGRPVTTPADRFPLDGFRVLSAPIRTVTFGDRIVVEGPDAPSLPTFQPGEHLVLLEILQGLSSDPIVGFQFPIARYFVTAGGTAAGRGGPGGEIVRLSAPLDGAQLPLEPPPTFEWMRVARASQFRLEIFEADPRAFGLGAQGGVIGLGRGPAGPEQVLARMEAVGAKVFGAVLQPTATRLPLDPAYLGRLRPRQVYLWKVTALDDRGEVIGTSSLRVIVFRGP